MPLKSKKRVKRSPLDTGKAVEAAEAEAPAFPNTGSSSKVLELPLELLMEILSYFHCLPIPITAVHNFNAQGIDFKLSSRYLERTDVLRALSQTCKLWRHLFFPMLWERLEPCLAHTNGGAWYKAHGDSMIRTSSLVCENPEIASHVRCV